MSAEPSTSSSSTTTTSKKRRRQSPSPADDDDDDVETQAPDAKKRRRQSPSPADDDADDASPSAPKKIRAAQSDDDGDAPIGCPMSEEKLEELDKLDAALRDLIQRHEKSERCRLLDVAVEMQIWVGQEYSHRRELIPDYEPRSIDDIRTAQYRIVFEDKLHRQEPPWSAGTELELYDGWIDAPELRAYIDMGVTMTSDTYHRLMKKALTVPIAEDTCILLLDYSPPGSHEHAKEYFESAIKRCASVDLCRRLANYISEDAMTQDYRDTLLGLAADSGETDVCAFLIELGADVKSNCGRPIRVAAREGHIHACRMFAAQGSPMRFYLDKLTPNVHVLEIAARRGRWDIVEWAYEQAVPEERTNALYGALEAESTVVAHYLLDQGVWPPLTKMDVMLRATRTNDTRLCRRLIERGGRVTDKKSKCLRLAFEALNVELCRLYLEHGAALTKNERRSLMFNKSAKAPLEWCRMLITCPEDALHTAVYRSYYHASGRRVDVCRMILDAHEDLDYKAGALRTSLNQAAADGHDDMCRLLIEYGEKNDVIRHRCMLSVRTGCFAEAIKHGRLSTCRLLTEAGLAPFERNYNLFNEIVGKGFDQIVRYLIDEHGYEARHDKSKALERAVWRGRLTTCRLLIEKGARVQDRTGDEDLVKAALKSGYEDVCRLLLEHGGRREPDPTGRIARVGRKEIEPDRRLASPITSFLKPVASEKCNE